MREGDVVTLFFFQAEDGIRDGCGRSDARAGRRAPRDRPRPRRARASRRRRPGLPAPSPSRAPVPSWNGRMVASTDRPDGRRSQVARMAAPKTIGRYTVERLLGSGSFATVWLAYDPGLDARVALKILAENWSVDQDIRRRFLEEARILWRAQHDRIVRVHLVEELDDGRPYFVMDYADGGTL